MVAALPDGSDQDFRFVCDDGAAAGETPIAHPALAASPPLGNPWRIVRVVTAQQRWNKSSAYDARLALAVQTDVGWFVDELQRVESKNGERNTLEAVSLEQQELIPEGFPELVLRYRARYQNPRNASDEKSSWLVLAGIGPSGSPGITRPVQLELSEESEPEEGGARTTQIDAFDDKFLPTGEVELTRSPRSTRKVSPQGDLAGVHKLSFP
jgi:hypothetical protein